MLSDSEGSREMKMCLMLTFCAFSSSPSKDATMSTICGTWSIFAGCVLYSVANYRPHLSHFWQKCNFPDPNLVTFYFYELTHFLN